MADRDDDLVYSTDHGRMCPRCGKASRQCTCARRDATPGGSPGRIRVQLSTQGRRGKTVTVIIGLKLGPSELTGLARDLKQRCGTGGTVKDGVIEIQGDRVRLVLELLGARGLDAS